VINRIFDLDMSLMVSNISHLYVCLILTMMGWKMVRQLLQV